MKRSAFIILYGVSASACGQTDKCISTIEKPCPEKQRSGYVSTFVPYTSSNGSIRRRDPVPAPVIVRQAVGTASRSASG
jgi:hypothetical protein